MSSCEVPSKPSATDERQLPLFTITDNLATVLLRNVHAETIAALLGDLRERATAHPFGYDKRSDDLPDPGSADKVTALGTTWSDETTLDTTPANEITTLDRKLVTVLSLLMSAALVHPENSGSPALPSHLKGLDRVEDRDTKPDELSHLTKSFQKAASLADLFPALIWICGPSGNRTYSNLAWYKLVGVQRHCARETELTRFIHADDADRYRDFVKRSICSRKNADILYRVVISDGTTRWIFENVTPLSFGDGDVGLAAAGIDITELRLTLLAIEKHQSPALFERLRELEKLSFTDPLTGLSNRRHIFSTLQSLFRSRIDRRSISVLYIDVDHFKHINDNLGHAAGDRVLSRIGRILLDSHGHHLVAGRIGGEEFVLVADVPTPSDALMIAESICREVSTTPFPGIPFTITVSIGVASSSDGDDHQSLLDRADRAMLCAKRDGRNRCHQASIDRTTVLETDLNSFCNARM